MLTPKQISQIKQDLQSGLTHKQVSVKNSVTENQVRNVVRNNPSLRRNYLLSDCQRKRIKELLSEGYKQVQISKKLGIDISHVRRIKIKQNSEASSSRS